MSFAATVVFYRVGSGESSSLSGSQKGLSWQIFSIGETKIFSFFSFIGVPVRLHMNKNKSLTVVAAPIDLN